MKASVLWGCLVWSVAAQAAPFPTPVSSPIPANIAIEAEETCTTSQISPIADSKAWSGTASPGAAETVFTTKKWGPQFLYVRPDVSLPPFVRDLEYEVSVHLKLSGVMAGGVRLQSDPGVVLFKPNASKYYKRSYVWPQNYAAERPYNVIGGKEFAMTKFGSTDGYSKYTLRFTATEPFHTPKQSVWIRFVLAERPTSNVITYTFRNLCVSRSAASRAPPPAIASYTEKFEHVLAPSPSTSELTEQQACPHHEKLVTWGRAKLPRPSAQQDGAADVSVPENMRVLIAAVDVNGWFRNILVPASSELVFADEPMTLRVRTLLVKGKLRVGSPTCRMQGPIKVQFWGNKGDPDHLSGHGSKGLAVVGEGEADLFGRRFFPTWTRLARKARAGDDRVYLQQAPNWLPGQEVVVLTTVPDDSVLAAVTQNEVMTIRSVQGVVVQFTKPLAHTHYAGTEYQGEVALLSRNVALEGTPDDDGYGGHSVIAGKRGRIAGVSSRYMGQTNTMARYPFHFHLLGEKGKNSYFSDNVVRDSYFRCYTVHGTNEAVLSENVAFNAFGSCFYLEDGVEESNVLRYNLAAHVKPIGAPAAGGSQTGEVILQDDVPGGLKSGKRLQPADASASCFYFSNAYNTIVGNVASGGWTGFGFPGFPKPIGNSRYVDAAPVTKPLKEFRGNTGHSTGWYWGATGAIYVGGVLEYTDSKKTRLKWHSGRMARDTKQADGTPVWHTFTNTLVYASNKGLLHWGNRVEVEQFEFHDVGRSVTLFGEAWLGRGIVNGVSGNVDATFVDRHHDGFQFYDISVKSVVTDIEFRNYKRAPCRYSQMAGEGPGYVSGDEDCGPNVANSKHFNVIFSGLYHSDVFKPQQISAVNKIKYTNVDDSLIVGHKVRDTGASRFFNFIDFDGSAAKTGVPTIVGSNLDWWNLCDDCVKHEGWGVWTCPKKPANLPEREVVHIKVFTPDISPANGGIDKSGVCDKSSTKWHECNVGSAALWGHGTDRSVIITSNAGITGLSGTGWHMMLDGGSPKALVVAPEQVVNGATLRFSVNYPVGTTFVVTASHEWKKSYSKTFVLAAKLEDVWADPENKYFFESGTLYLSPRIDAAFDAKESFERGGARVFDTQRFFKIRIEADCAADAKGFCAAKPVLKVPEFDMKLVCATIPATPLPPTAGTLAPFNRENASVVWCQNDNTCQVYKDMHATCAEDRCSCSEGFGPMNGAGVCVGNDPESVWARVTLKIVFTWEVDCANYNQTFTPLIQATLASVVHKNVTIAVLCGSLTATALVDGMAPASALTVGDDFVTALGTAYANDAAYSAMSSGLGLPARHDVIVVTGCAFSETSQVQRVNTTCSVISCKDGFVMKDNLCTATAVQSSGGGGLSAGAIAAIVVCSILVLVVVAVVGFLFLKKGTPVEEGKEASELSPTNSHAPDSPVNNGETPV